MSQHYNIIDLSLWLWHGINLAAFGLTISPALENAEAYVRICSGIVVGLSALVALVFTLRKNLPKKRK